MVLLLCGITIVLYGGVREHIAGKEMVTKFTTAFVDTFSIEEVIPISDSILLCRTKWIFWTSHLPNFSSGRQCQTSWGLDRKRRWRKIPNVQKIYFKEYRKCLSFENTKSLLSFIPNPVLETFGISFPRDDWGKLPVRNSQAVLQIIIFSVQQQIPHL